MHINDKCTALQMFTQGSLAEGGTKAEHVSNNIIYKQS